MCACLFVTLMHLRQWLLIAACLIAHTEKHYDYNNMTTLFWLSIPSAVVSLDAFVDAPDVGCQVPPVGVGHVRAP